MLPGILMELSFIPTQPPPELLTGLEFGSRMWPRPCTRRFAWPGFDGNSCVGSMAAPHLIPVPPSPPHLGPTSIFLFLTNNNKQKSNLELLGVLQGLFLPAGGGLGRRLCSAGGGCPHRAAFLRGRPFFPALMCSCPCRITRSSLRFNPAFPADISKLTLTGICYLGSKLKFTITKEEIRVQVTASPREPLASLLEAVLEESGQRFPLREGTGSPP